MSPVSSWELASKVTKYPSPTEVVTGLSPSPQKYVLKSGFKSKSGLESYKRVAGKFDEFFDVEYNA